MKRLRTPHYEFQQLERKKKLDDTKRGWAQPINQLTNFFFNFFFKREETICPCFLSESRCMDGRTTKELREKRRLATSHFLDTSQIQKEKKKTLANQ